jgi:hypothetical protein
MEGKACLIFIGVLEHQGNERNTGMSAGGLLEKSGNNQISTTFLSMLFYLNNPFANHLDFASY